jgi:SAM-dependent methyltransferase
MQHGFDTTAGTYDALFTRSLIGSAQRELVRDYLDGIVPAGSRRSILDLGCGTGEDALWLARRGHTVTAVDASVAMVEAARVKLSAEKIASTVTLLHSPMEEIGSAGIEGPFDLVLSNFGGMNCCSPEALARLAPGLRRLLAPGGRLVAVVMTRFCAWESLYFLAHGNAADAFRRRSRSAVTARLDGADVPVWYYSPSSLAGAFGAPFIRTAVRPVGAFIPPSFLEPFVARHPVLFRFLSAGERRLARTAALAAVADHALIEFQVRR